MDRATRIMLAALLTLAVLGLVSGVVAAVLPTPLEVHWQRAASVVPFVVSTAAVLGVFGLLVSRRRRIPR